MAISFTGSGTPLMSVSARDHGTGRIQRVTVTPSTGLNEYDIERLVAEGIPAHTPELRRDVGRYLEFRAAGFNNWHPIRREMLITTRFGDTNQLHWVKGPGGDRRQVPGLARAAVATGFVDGLFFEVHPDPDKAPSDGPNMVALKDFERVLKRVLAFDALSRTTPVLVDLKPTGKHYMEDFHRAGSIAARGDIATLCENSVIASKNAPHHAASMTRFMTMGEMIPARRVFRRDDDITHSPMFQQIEGLVVGRGIHLGHLKGTIEAFLHALFGEEYPVRFRASYFPYTEPSVEADLGCIVCGGSGSLAAGPCRIEHPHLDALAEVEAAEALGFDVVWFTEHHFALHGLNSGLTAWLAADDVTEILVNQPHEVWVERMGADEMECHDAPAIDARLWVSGSSEACPLEVDVEAGTTSGTCDVTPGVERANCAASMPCSPPRTRSASSSATPARTSSSSRRARASRLKSSPRVSRSRNATG